MPGCAILGTGLALPERIVGNAELERRVGAPNEWVVARTGIVTRRMVDGSRATSDLAVAAIAAGLARTVLLIGADALTRHVDEDDRNTAILFGDGAGAVVLGPGEGLLGVTLGADGRAADDLCIPAGGSRRPVDAEALAVRAHKIRMNGAEVFRAAVHAMTEGLVAALDAAGLEPRRLRWVVAHQANARILRGVAERLDLPLEAFWMNLQRLGNTGAASIPIALAEAVDAGALRPGDLIGLTAAGAGLVWG